MGILGGLLGLQGLFQQPMNLQQVMPSAAQGGGPPIPSMQLNDMRQNQFLQALQQYSQPRLPGMAGTMQSLWGAKLPGMTNTMGTDITSGLKSLMGFFGG